MPNYVEHILPGHAPQSEQADPRQVPNSAGGFTFQLDSWGRLDRWLILGAPTATYYASARKLTQENAACVVACLKEDGMRTVARIRELSVSGRAPKNDPAVFALALVFVHGQWADQQLAAVALREVCRTGTQLFQFVETVNALRGWGRGLRRAVASWYTSKDDKDLAYQLLKYQQRGSWSHKGVLQLVHPKLPHGPERANAHALLRWSLGLPLAERFVKRPNGRITAYPLADGAKLDPRIEAFQELSKPDVTVARAVALITEHRLTHEMVPRQLHGHREVWEALLSSMPLHALLRNVARLTALGILAEGSAWASQVAQRLTNPEALKGARVHPIAVLSAGRVYAQGHGAKGQLSWEPVRAIREALETAFYMSFGTLNPTNKRILLGIDVSPSMDAGDIAGVPGLTPRNAAAAMAMVLARTEPAHGFCGFSHELVPLPITADMKLEQVEHVMRRVPMGGTDCAKPILYAIQGSLAVDAFITLTDNETWYGAVHPHVALKRYRSAFVKDAKLIVAGFTSTDFTIADPSDAGSLDIVGFDTAAPQLIADFIRGS